MGYGVRGAGCGVWVQGTGYEIRVRCTGYGVRTGTGCRVRGTGYRIQGRHPASRGSRSVGHAQLPQQPHRAEVHRSTGLQLPQRPHRAEVLGLRSVRGKNRVTVRVRVRVRVKLWLGLWLGLGTGLDEGPYLLDHSLALLHPSPAPLFLHP